MKSVAVIGAGITGLTAAFCLQRKGIAVTVYEAGRRAGGVIQSLRANGYLAESGPNTILETSPKVAQLVVDAGLASRRIYSDARAAARYLVHDHRPVAMPGSPFGFLTTPLFSARAKLALLREPFVPPRRDGAEESLAEFVRRRLGREVLERAIDALAAGIYAGDPEKLSLPHAFPKLAQLEARYGSLIKGQVLGGRDRKRRGEVAKDRAPKFSFDEGLQVLPDALCAKLADAVRLDTPVDGLAQTAEGWRLRERTGQMSAVYGAVIFAGTAFRLAELKIDTVPEAALAGFTAIRYSPVASVVLGFRREDVAHPCQGFGMLVPGIERLNILGTIFSSSLFPNRAPAGHLTLTTYVGGERQLDLAGLPPAKLVKLVCADLRVLLGVTGQPTFSHWAVYSQAIPQYNIGYGCHRDAMAELERQTPGFFLAGHYRDGVSLSDSIVSGSNVADRVEQFLEAAAIRRPDARVAA